MNTYIMQGVFIYKSFYSTTPQRFFNIYIISKANAIYSQHHHLMFF